MHECFAHAGEVQHSPVNTNSQCPTNCLPPAAAGAACSASARTVPSAVCPDRLSEEACLRGRQSAM